jgi:hypothetical protein
MAIACPSTITTITAVTPAATYLDSCCCCCIAALVYD